MIDTAAKKSCLQTCGLFADLDPSTLGVLAEAMEAESYGADDEVCEYGEQADCVWVIMEGELGVYLPGVEEPVRRMHPGQILGEYGMFGGVRTTTVMAEREAVLLTMDYERFRSFLYQYPQALYRLLEVAVARLEQAEARLRGAGGKG
jgi:CRP-like cAMP-binding protein